MDRKFNFDEITFRRGSGAEKWDKPAPDVLPMWVADMDFRTAPCIIEALEKRVEHGIFGYTRVGTDYYDALVNWFHKRHGWTINPDDVIYTIGVVPAISAIIKAMTRHGDRIIVQTPAYNCFYSSIRNNGCVLAAAPLVYSPSGYTIDFDALEQLASQEDVKLLLLCNPHNPVGRVWTREELQRIGDICIKHNVFVISDEIHCELTFEGHDYTPYNSLGKQYAEKAAVCISPSKAFNIAGLQIANIVSENPEVLKKIDRAINDNEVCDVNPFGVRALIAAYNEGYPWLCALKEYLWQNYLCVKEFFEKTLPAYPILPLEGTYLVWINCEASGLDSDAVSKILLEKERMMVSPGSMYGQGGENFLRLNIACQRERLLDGLQRLGRVLGELAR